MTKKIKINKAPFLRRGVGERLKIAILASGSGSNAENIANYFQDNEEVEIALIGTNRPDAYVLERAKKLGILAYQFTKQDLDNGLVSNTLISKGIDFVVLAGFLLKIPADFVNAFPNAIINIHPALLPKYGGKGMYGMKVHEAVKAAGEKESGITIHYVNENYDEGDTIFQATCSVEDSDTAEDIAEKIHALEYRHFPEVISKLAAS